MTRRGGQGKSVYQLTRLRDYVTRAGHHEHLLKATGYACLGTATLITALLEVALSCTNVPSAKDLAYQPGCNENIACGSCVP